MRASCHHRQRRIHRPIYWRRCKPRGVSLPLFSARIQVSWTRFGISTMSRAVCRRGRLSLPIQVRTSSLTFFASAKTRSRWLNIRLPRNRRPIPPQIRLRHLTHDLNHKHYFHHHFCRIHPHNRTWNPFLWQGHPSSHLWWRSERLHHQRRHMVHRRHLRYLHSHRIRLRLHPDI